MEISPENGLLTPLLLPHSVLTISTHSHTHNQDKPHIYTHTHSINQKSPRIKPTARSCLLMHVTGIEGLQVSSYRILEQIPVDSPTLSTCVVHLTLREWVVGGEGSVQGSAIGEQVLILLRLHSQI